MTIAQLKKKPPRSQEAAEPLPILTPSQASTLEQALTVIANQPVLGIKGDAGTGKTAVLQHMHARLGGRFIDCGEALDAMSVRHPHALEEAIRGLLEEALRYDDIVFFDDVDVIAVVTKMANAFPRPYLFVAVLKDFFQQLRTENKRVILSGSEVGVYSAIEDQAVVLECPSLTPDDYAAVIKAYLGETNVAGLNIEHIYRNSGKLTIYQLQATCRILISFGKTAPSTDEFSACLSQYMLSSNLDVEEVEAVEFSDMKGAEEIVEKLDRTILLPLTQPELAKSLGLKPKRGVLLHGHPGTGKTSIGRALARQMEGKFFMIDGTFIGGSGSFFKKVNKLFADAIANSPSIIFIDDADVLFKSDNGGFNRYLLTKLDGLASESVGHVCVMMTAMDIADMPVAMLRSGRVEVWLETKLPTPEVRIEIVRHYAADLPEEHKAFDAGTLAQLTDGFTPADLRRLVGDARGFLAYDQFKGREPKSFETYLHVAAAEIADVKGKIASVTQKKR